jgi:hypothetical protein
VTAAAAAEEKEEELVQPVIPESFIQDLSGSSVAAVPVPVPEPVAVPVPEPVPEPTVAAPTVAAPTVTAPTTPTIVVDTEPAKVSFTSMDTFFDSRNPNQNSIHEPVLKADDDEDDDAGVTSLEISNDPPEPVDDYENLEETEALPIDEFETL